jgi:hypothetical protein
MNERTNSDFAWTSEMRDREARKLAAARLEERAKIVAFLREKAEDASQQGYEDVYREMAGEIERLP